MNGPGGLDCETGLVAESADLNGVPLFPEDTGGSCFSGLELREAVLDPNVAPDAEGPRSKELCLAAREPGVGSGLFPLRVGEDVAEFDDDCDEDTNDDVDDLVEIELGGVLRTDGRVGDDGAGAWTGMGLGFAPGNVCRRKTDGTTGIDSGRAFALDVGVGSGRRESLAAEEEGTDPIWGGGLGRENEPETGREAGTWAWGFGGV